MVLVYIIYGQYCEFKKIFLDDAWQWSLSSVSVLISCIPLSRSLNNSELQFSHLLVKYNGF